MKDTKKPKSTTLRKKALTEKLEAIKKEKAAALAELNETTDIINRSMLCHFIDKRVSEKFLEYKREREKWRRLMQEAEKAIEDGKPYKCPSNDQNVFIFLTLLGFQVYEYKDDKFMAEYITDEESRRDRISRAAAQFGLHDPIPEGAYCDHCG